MKRIPFTLGKLEHALTLQSCGSFSRAAQELGLAQPSLSRSIASLEAIWDVQIFERGRSGVQATRIGTELLQEAERLVSLARTLDSNMQLRGNAMAGAVAFGMSGLTSTVFMPEILTFLTRRSPNLQITTKVEPLAVLLDLLAKDAIEFAIYVDDIATDDPAFASEWIGEMPIDLIARADHPLAKSTSPSWKDFGRYPVVCTSYMKLGQMDVIPSIICDNFSVAKDFMLSSDAIWLASRFAAREELERGTVKTLKPKDFSAPAIANIWVTKPTNRMKTPAGNLVIDHLRKTYRGMMPAGTASD
jgi:DNA-binding transcriptional LysR family regulator